MLLVTKQKSVVVYFLLGVISLWRLMQRPSNIWQGCIHCPAGHVTVLMLKNALVNINRPGWQDKFAFMPEEEKTSISLTQRLHHFLGGGQPPRVGGVTPNCVYFRHAEADVPG